MKTSDHNHQPRKAPAIPVRRTNRAVHRTSDVESRLYRRIAFAAAVLMVVAVIITLLITRPWQSSFTLLSESLTVELGTPLHFEAADWIDANPNQMETISIDLSQVNTMVAGSYQIVVTNQRHQKTISVQVVDTTPPRGLPVSSPLLVLAGETVLADQLVDQVVDFSDVMISFDEQAMNPERVFIEPGDHETSVFLTDAAGNQTNYVVIIRVLLPDTTPPVFHGVQDRTIRLGDDFDPLEQVTAMDETDGDLSASIQVSGQVDTTQAGQYTLVYQVQDSSGNQVKIPRVLTVEDPLADLKKANDVTVQGSPAAHRTANQVLEYLGSDAARMGIVYINLTNDDVFEMNADRQFRSASTAKVFVNMALYEMVEQGEVDLAHVLYFTDDDYEGGTGILQNMDLSAGYSLATLADYAMMHSDNIAFRMIRRFVGRSASFDYYESIIGHATDRSMTSMSAADGAALLLRLYSAEYDSFDHMLEVMRKTDFNNMLPRYLPDGTVAHKIGFYSTFYHDIGIVYDGDSAYIIAVFSDNLTNPEDTIAQVSKIIYDSRK